MVYFCILFSTLHKYESGCLTVLQYDKQDHQGRAAFNERYPQTAQQQDPAARSPGGHKTNRTRRKAEHRQDNH
jgi:hypothetical protein